MSPGLKRISLTRPGYDNGPSGGRENDQWLYGVTDGSFGLALSVYSCELRGAEVVSSVIRPPEYPKGRSFFNHSKRPLTRDRVQHPYPRTDQVCEFLDDGLGCYIDDGRLSFAADFFKAHGRPVFDQPESFWLALEAQWVVDRAHVRESYETIAQCDRCKGQGLVPRCIAHEDCERDVMLGVACALKQGLKLPE